MMNIKELANKLIKINNKLLDYARDRVLVELSNEDSEQVIYSLNFTSENLHNLIENFQKYEGGSQMFILTCLNNYEWSEQSLLTAFAKMSENWDDKLDSIKSEMLDLYKQVRKILIEYHNEGIPDDRAEDRIPQDNE